MLYNSLTISGRKGIEKKIFITDILHACCNNLGESYKKTRSFLKLAIAIWMAIPRYGIMSQCIKLLWLVPATTHFSYITT